MTERPDAAPPPRPLPLDEAFDAWWRAARRAQLRRDRQGGTGPPADDTDDRGGDRGGP